jgi:hypothetical protein
MANHIQQSLRFIQLASHNQSISFKFNFLFPPLPGLCLGQAVQQEEMDLTHQSEARVTAMHLATKIFVYWTFKYCSTPRLQHKPIIIDPRRTLMQMHVIKTDKGGSAEKINY